MPNSGAAISGRVRAVESVTNKSTGCRSPLSRPLGESPPTFIQAVLRPGILGSGKQILQGKSSSQPTRTLPLAPLDFEGRTLCRCGDVSSQVA